MLILTSCEHVWRLGACERDYAMLRTTRGGLAASHCVRDVPTITLNRCSCQQSRLIAIVVLRVNFHLSAHRNVPSIRQGIFRRWVGLTAHLGWLSTSRGTVLIR